ncbi:TetR/AcrR family transcriptional regulator [Nocardia sp. NPDC052254]|jgi:AcrR family transcriptional regulator|uniref:TetR/AcrR family transcriptional regulator n=1 Tax=Nocardia sp. NPDC052254 TaxID=3155681 RepID=UPI003412FE34
MSRPERPRQRYGGVDFTDRRVTRRERLLDVTLDLLDTEGLAAVTVRRVCREARLNARYFYESFADLDALFDGLVDRLESEVVQRVTELAGMRSPALPEQAMAILVDAFVDDPRLLRILHTAAEPTLRARRQALVLRSVAAIRPYLEADAAVAGRPDPRLLDTAAFLLIGGWTDVLFAFGTGELAIERGVLIDHLTTLFHAVARAASAVEGR